MDPNKVIIFVCEHGAAKSIIAATFFNQIAKQRGLNLTAIARGTAPDLELSEQTINGLSSDGLTPAESSPKNLSSQEVESAQSIVSFCELPKEFEQIVVERWEGIPAVSEDYNRARDAIIERLNDFLDHIKL